MTDVGKRWPVVKAPAVEPETPRRVFVAVPYELYLRAQEFAAIHTEGDVEAFIAKALAQQFEPFHCELTALPAA